MEEDEGACCSGLQLRQRQGVDWASRGREHACRRVHRKRGWRCVHELCREVARTKHTPNYHQPGPREVPPGTCKGAHAKHAVVCLAAPRDAQVDCGLID